MNLIELVAQKVELKPSTAGDWIGLCPFHLEKTPSFRVNEKRYICFGCGVRGGRRSWERQYQLPPTQCRAIKQDDLAASAITAKRLFETNKLAQSLFRQRIPSEYLMHRFGDNYRRFGLGSCPSLEVLLNVVPVGDCIDAGLVTTLPGSSQIFCPLSERLTIPLKDARGNILGFIGRALPESSRPKPKYVNPRSHARFKASNYLFGLHKLTPYSYPTIYVTEGPLDAMAFWFNGMLNAVSVLGSNISKEQMVLLASYSKHITLCFDGDLAGLRAVYRLIPKLIDSGCDVDVILPPDKLDPDERFLKQSNEWLKEVISLPITSFLNQRLILPMSNKKYDRTLLDDLTRKYVEDNIKKGYQHLNCIPYVISAFPEHATSIKQAVELMCSDLEETPLGFSPKREHILNFIREWIKPCREIRKLHAKEENQQ